MQNIAFARIENAASDPRSEAAYFMRFLEKAGSDIGQNGGQQQRAACHQRHGPDHLLLALVALGLRSHWTNPPVVNKIEIIIAQKIQNVQSFLKNG